MLLLEHLGKRRFLVAKWRGKCGVVPPVRFWKIVDRILFHHRDMKPAKEEVVSKYHSSYTQMYVMPFRNSACTFPMSIQLLPRIKCFPTATDPGEVV